MLCLPLAAIHLSHYRCIAEVGVTGTDMHTERTWAYTPTHTYSHIPKNTKRIPPPTFQPQQNGSVDSKGSLAVIFHTDSCQVEIDRYTLFTKKSDLCGWPRSNFNLSVGE